MSIYDYLLKIIKFEEDFNHKILNVLKLISIESILINKNQGLCYKIATSYINKSIILGEFHTGNRGVRILLPLLTEYKIPPKIFLEAIVNGTKIQEYIDRMNEELLSFKDLCDLLEHYLIYDYNSLIIRASHMKDKNFNNVSENIIKNIIMDYSFTRLILYCLIKKIKMYGIDHTTYYHIDKNDRPLVRKMRMSMNEYACQQIKSNIREKEKFIVLCGRAHVTQNEINEGIANMLKTEFILVPL